MKKQQETTVLNSIKVKKEVLSLLESFECTLSSREQDARQEYTEVGLSDEQKTDWRTGELLWEDEEKTIPIYKPIYDYVDKKESELDDDDRAKLEAIDIVRKALNALI